MKTSAEIGEIIRKYYAIDKDLFYSKTRKREVVQARQMAHFFAKIYTNESLALIGLSIGNKDHATVLHSNRTIIGLIDTYKDIRIDVENIDKLINPKLKYEITIEEIKSCIYSAIIKRFAKLLRHIDTM